ncbi:uncharacterized protein LOC129884267 [Solanum dulcamara]|uniref:uncharacterized protein LOC129884267 n=1 Tax=Solanum dulcamara TaxID=45834 RepID=UPI002485FECF|nr:uncharacterized protein LOC129884267 [Solanum dulcamara]
MASVGIEALPVYELRKGKEKQEFKKVEKYLSKVENKESMNVNASPVKFTMKPGARRGWTTTKIFWWPLYILAAIDYISKCVEAIALKEVKKDNVANFIRVNIIYRFGIPSYIITDNGKSFANKLIDKICDLFGFKQRNSSMYYAAANGLAEAFNKTLCSLLKKAVSKSKREWHDRIKEALWAYRTTHRMPTQATSYSLIFGAEAVFLLQSQIPSL